MYSNNQSSLSSHLQRERSLRQTYTESLGAAPEITPANNKLTRSQSTAGLTNGLDLKVVILGAQGESLYAQFCLVLLLTQDVCRSGKDIACA